jgi:NO-binding membrane sensor protein with MHYT domain
LSESKKIQQNISYISAVSKTGFGIFSAHLVCLKSEKSEMPGNFQVYISRITLIPSS